MISPEPVSQQQIHHHRDHDIHPTRSDQGQGTIKIKQNYTGGAGVGALGNNFNHVFLLWQFRIRSSEPRAVPAL